jgi:hypothetical protein
VCDVQYARQARLGVKSGHVGGCDSDMKGRGRRKKEEEY